MTLVESLRALVARRAELVSELSAIDQDLRSARAWFAELDAPASVGRRVTSVVEITPVPVEEPASPVEPALGIETIRASLVAIGPQSIGTLARNLKMNEWTLRDRVARLVAHGALIMQKKAAGHGRLVALPGTAPMVPPPLRAKDHTPKPALLERRCVERRCLKKFKPANDGQIYCEDCLKKKGAPSTSWHAKATKKPDDRFETVWNGGEGLSGVGPQRRDS